MTIPGRHIALLSLAVLLGVLLCSCQPGTRHKVLSTLFDGVPELPPKKEYCRDTTKESPAALLPGESSQMLSEDAGDEAGNEKSVHLPYEEKLCSDCHSEDNNKNGGFIAAKQELCYVCHETFSGGFLHGPVAVGECTACHDPHKSQNPALLIAERDKVCKHCHEESRLAAEMHRNIAEHEMACQECHDPHAGALKYFLK